MTTELIVFVRSPLLTAYWIGIKKLLSLPGVDEIIIIVPRLLSPLRFFNIDVMAIGSRIEYETGNEDSHPECGIGFFG